MPPSATGAAVAEEHDARVPTAPGPDTQDPAAPVPAPCAGTQPPASSTPPEEKAGELVAVVAHDLLEPLSTVTGFLQLLQRGHGHELSADAKEILGWALRGTAEMSERIEALLDQARLGATEPVVESIDLAAAVARAGAALSGSIIKSDARIEVPAGSVPVDADPNLFDRVLRQLLSNAVKFRRPNERPHVTVKSVRRGPITELKVSDNGIGIDPAYRQRIFAMFVRADTGRPGFGIGLAQCRAIAEMHGGDIRIEDSELGGAAIVMTFPVQSR